MQTDLNFLISPLWISIKTATVSTIIAFIISIHAAYWRNMSKSKKLTFLDGLLILPLVLPPTLTGYLLLLILGRYSFIGKLLSSIGVSVIFSWTSTVIAAFVVSFPIMYHTARAAFILVDKNYIDEAKVCGLGNFHILWQVLLPLSFPSIAAGTVLAFARALGEFGATLMIAGNIPGKTQTIPIALFFAVESGEYSQAAILAIVSMTISIAVLLLINRLMKNNL